MSKTVTISPPYKPNPKQLLLHNAPASINSMWIILYGGSRGGGKSAGILADAFLFANTYPGAKICILRESLDAVKQSFLDKLPSLFPQKVQGVTLYDYKEKSSSWYPSRSLIFPNGSYITFQRVANYQEAIAKQGWEFHYLAIDEVTKQEERTFDYLLTCVRSAEIINPYTDKPIRIPTKVVLGCNPGGVGHKWVKERFISPTVIKKDEHNTPIQTKDHVEFIQDPHNPLVKIKQYIRFIPASVKDNKFLNPSYVANLAKLPENKKKMDLYGDWDVVAGRVFDLKPEQVIGEKMANLLMHKYKDKIQYFVSIDWGFKPSYHSAHWHALIPGGFVLTFQELYGQELIFEDFVKEIADMSDGYEIEVTCLPHDMFRQGDQYRDTRGRIIGQTKSDVFEYNGLNPISVESGKGKVQMRIDKIHSAMTIKQDRTNYKFLISKACPMLIEELENAVHDEFNPEAIHASCKDHALDDYGLFLVFYSDDIEIIGQEKLYQEQKSRLEKILEQDELLLEEEEQNYSISFDDFYDSY